MKKVVIFMIIIVAISSGTYMGYSISKNGGGLQGALATGLGQDIEKLENVDPINVLLLRSK